MTRKVTDLPWECGKGWWPLIEKVAAAIDSFNAANPDSPVEVSQIKQKSTSMSSARRVFLDYRIPKNSGSRPSDFFNEQVSACHSC